MFTPNKFDLVTFYSPVAVLVHQGYKLLSQSYPSNTEYVDGRVYDVYSSVSSGIGDTVQAGVKSFASYVAFPALKRGVQIFHDVLIEEGVPAIQDTVSKGVNVSKEVVGAATDQFAKEFLGNHSIANSQGIWGNAPKGSVDIVEEAKKAISELSPVVIAVAATALTTTAVAFAYKKREAIKAVAHQYYQKVSNTFTSAPRNFTFKTKKA